MLNGFTANAIGKTVYAGPSEATAIGNLLMQAKAAGLVSDKKEMRQIIRNSVELEVFSPEYSQVWDSNYQKYLAIFKEI